MVLKRQFGGEGSDKSHNPNHSQNQRTKFQKIVKYAVTTQEILTILEPALRRVIKEEVEPLIAALLQSSPRRSLVYHPESVPSRGAQLLFINKLPSTLFTNSKVEDEDRAPLLIQLVDTNSKNIIDVGPLSSIKVEIVVLSGDFAAIGKENWTQSEFNDRVVREREGKRPLLVGERHLALVNGVGSIGTINFTDNSSWIRSRKFKLGVRVAGSTSLGTDIREAVSEAFVVLDHRGESYQKHRTPSLDDPVWRLRKISKEGASHKKLKLHRVMTVKDFLVHYHMHPLSLRRVLGKGVANKAWDQMVRHANECHLEDTHYTYRNEAENAVLLLNCVYKVVAVRFAGRDYHVDSLDSRQKELLEKLKQAAFSNLNELVLHQSSAEFFPLGPPIIEHNVPFSSPGLDLLQDGFSVIDQDGAENKLDFNLSDSASYPCTMEDGNLPEDDSASQTDQPVQGIMPDPFIMGSSSAVPSDIGNNWYLDNNPFAAFAQNFQFEGMLHPQTQSSYPFASVWGQEGGLFMTSTPAAPIGFLSQLPDLGVNISGTRTPKAGWCKIRAAVMWKIVRRNAAARRKARFPFSYTRADTTTHCF